MMRGPKIVWLSKWYHRERPWISVMRRLYVDKVETNKAAFPLIQKCDVTRTAFENSHENRTRTNLSSGQNNEPKRGQQEGLERAYSVLKVHSLNYLWSPLITPFTVQTSSFKITLPANIP